MPPAPAARTAVNRPAVITALALWTLVVFTAGAGSLAAERAARTADPTPATAPPPRPTGSSSTSAPPDRAAVRIGGAVGSMRADGRVAQTVGLPLTFVSAEQGGSSGAEITGVLVGTDLVSIVWDAGRPLVLGGDGGIGLEGVTVTLAGGDLQAGLVDATVRLEPGTFLVDTPVAVGRAGLAEPRDQVTFVIGATEVAAIEFRGDFSVTLPAAPIAVAGPGALTLDGAFSYEGADGSEQETSRIVLDDGDYLVSLAPFEGGWLVDGTVPAEAIVG